jgi:hypothetical protein
MNNILGYGLYLSLGLFRNSEYPTETLNLLRAIQELYLPPTVSDFSFLVRSFTIVHMCIFCTKKLYLSKNKICG